MLIPQFSIRWLLAVTALCAGAFSVVGLAVQGQRWALAVSVGLGAVLLTMLLYGAAFGLVWACALVLGRSGRRGRGGDPFARGQSPAVGGRLPEAEAPATPILLE